MYKQKGRAEDMEIRPISELRNTTAISELCHSIDEPVFGTKNGHSDLVVLSMEAYENLLATMATDDAIREAERQFDHDVVLLDARETLGKLRKKHFW